MEKFSFCAGRSPPGEWFVARVSKDFEDIRKYIIFSYFLKDTYREKNTLKWDRAFKSGLSNYFGTQPLKILRDILSRPYFFKFFKGCFP